LDLETRPDNRSSREAILEMGYILLDAEEMKKFEENLKCAASVKQLSSVEQVGERKRFANG
jgi:hypothetical protein